jgi:hypothetical protein
LIREDVLHAVQDALSLPHGRRQGRERVVHEHDVGDATGGLRPALQCDRQVRGVMRPKMVASFAA